MQVIQIAYCEITIFRHFSTFVVFVETLTNLHVNKNYVLRGNEKAYVTVKTTFHQTVQKQNVTRAQSGGAR